MDTKIFSEFSGHPIETGFGLQAGALASVFALFYE
jgi:hypothetical protein